MEFTVIYKTQTWSWFFVQVELNFERELKQPIKVPKSQSAILGRSHIGRFVIDNYYWIVLSLNMYSYMRTQFCGVSKQVHSFFTPNNLSNACLQI